MTIKERVLSTMKTSYAKYGFKKEELNKLADIVATNLTEEATDDDVNNAITNAEGYAQMMQSVYNRGVSETSDKYKDYIPKPVEPPKPTEPPTGGLTLEEVQKLIAEANANKQKEIDDAVSKAMAPILEKERASHLANLLQGHDKLKTIPQKFRSKYILDKEDNLDLVVSQIENDWAETKQELISSGVFVEAPPKADPQSETDDFVKMMEGFAQRHGGDGK